MDFLVTVQIAFRALWKNKVRAALTVLGVVIGIAAVTTMVSLGQSASELVQGQLQGLGTNVLVVFPTNARQGGVRQDMVPTLTAKDADAIVEECPAVLAASPIVGVPGQVVYGNLNWQPKPMLGVGPDYLVVRNWPLQYGDFYTERDITSLSKVCVIGQSVVAQLFQTTNPIGETVRIKNTPFRVIGVLERKGANMLGDDQDNIVLIPYSTALKRIQGSTFSNVHAIMVSARTQGQMNDAAVQTRQLLQERHKIAPGDPPDFVVQSTMEIAGIVAIVMGAITLMLSTIAGISLLVGGVGIMNIMLVSVTERTREIGVRMAMGARARDILRQFLVEAVLLSSLGGAFGILLGIGASVGMTLLINAVTTGTKWPVVVSLPAAAVALVFSAAVGIFFGYYPARRASRLDPIEALRYE